HALGDPAVAPASPLGYRLLSGKPAPAAHPHFAGDGGAAEVRVVGQPFQVLRNLRPQLPGGVSTSARGLRLLRRQRSRSSRCRTGSRNAAVLPLPVMASASRSRPWIAGGIASCPGGGPRRSPIDPRFRRHSLHAGTHGRGRSYRYSHRTLSRSQRRDPVMRKLTAFLTLASGIALLVAGLAIFSPRAGHAEPAGGLPELQRQPAAPQGEVAPLRATSVSQASQIAVLQPALTAETNARSAADATLAALAARVTDVEAKTAPITVAGADFTI